MQQAAAEATAHTAFDGVTTCQPQHAEPSPGGAFARGAVSLSHPRAASTVYVSIIDNQRWQ